MRRLATLLSLTLFIHCLTPSFSEAQCSCAVPSYTGPSCSAPTMPSCAVPGCGPVCHSCGSCQGCQSDHCSECKTCKEKDKKRTFNFHFNRTVVKNNVFGGFGAKPPENTTVLASMPVITLNQLAVPINVTAGTTSSNPRSNNTVASSDDECKDPCGDIKELQKNMNEMIRFTKVMRDRIDLEDQQALQNEERMQRIEDAIKKLTPPAPPM